MPLLTIRLGISWFSHSLDPDLALFSNIQSSLYWSSTAFAPDPNDAWKFLFNDGSQSAHNKVNVNYAWAVRTGDVVPVPGAVWLFGSGLIGLISVSRRKKA